jgi:hypothetical protein
MLHPDLLDELARLHQHDLLQEAARERLAAEALHADPRSASSNASFPAFMTGAFLGQLGRLNRRLGQRVVLREL